ncbi:MULTISPECIES: hypothetical protein [Enterobacterales]
MNVKPSPLTVRVTPPQLKLGVRHPLITGAALLHNSYSDTSAMSGVKCRF